MQISPFQRCRCCAVAALAAAAFLVLPPDSARAQSSTSSAPTSIPPVLSEPGSLDFTSSSSSSVSRSPVLWSVPAVRMTPRQQVVDSPQERPVEASAALGFATFVDEDFIDHVTVAGSVRVPFSSRWSVEPRFIYMRAGAEDQDFYAMASLIYDMAPLGRVTPYWTIGAGYFWHRSVFPAFAGFEERTFVSGEPHLSGGFGARIRVADRWSVVSELRLGWEPILQFNAGLGYRF